MYPIHILRVVSWISPLLLLYNKIYSLSLKQTNIFDDYCLVMHIMEEDWNDVAQSERDEPKLITQIILILFIVAMVMVFFLGM